MRAFSNYQLILLIFIFTATLVLSKSVKYDTMDTLLELQSLKPGFGLTSNNGKYKMDYGTDGTLNTIGIVTDKNGNIEIDKKTGMVKTKTVWPSKEKRTSNTEGAITLEDGKIAMYDYKGEERWGPYGKEDEGEDSRLVMQDNGVLALYNSANEKTWSVPSKAPEEGFEEYDEKITQKRADLEDKTRELVQLASSESKYRMDWSILVNILWTVIASSLLYYLIVN